MDSDFVPGLTLAKSYFSEVVEPLVNQFFPDLAISAALSGDGSEILGYDDAVSSDHDWGPRLQLYIRQADFASRAAAIVTMLTARLPEWFMGFATRFPDSDRVPGLAIGLEYCASDAHGVEVFTVQSFFRRHLGISIASDPSALSWLSIPAQKLLAVTSGEVFRDDTAELSRARELLKYFPDDVWLYLLASQWERIDQEQSFVGRAGERGDELGSQIIAGRLARELMYLCLLMERTYAPYPKWLGTAFCSLNYSGPMAVILKQIFAAPTWRARENALCRAYVEAGRLHHKLGIPGDIQAIVGRYHTRNNLVVNARAIAQAIRDHITNTDLLDAPFGSIDQISENPELLGRVDRCHAVTSALYAFD